MNDNVKMRGRRNIVATWPKCFHGVRAAKHQTLVPGIHVLSGLQVVEQRRTIQMYYKYIKNASCFVSVPSCLLV